MTDAVQVDRTAPSAGIPSAAPSTGGRFVGWVRTSNELRTAIVLIALIIVFTILRPNFASGSNISTIITISSILGIITLGQTIVLISGGFDLSVGGVVPLAAVVFASSSAAGFPFLAALAVAIGLGVVVGILNAVVIGRFGVNALISTLGMMSVATGAAYVISSGQTIPIDIKAGVLGDPSFLFSLPTFAVVAIVLVIIVDIFLRWTVAGRLVYSIGANLEASRVAGIRVERVRGMAYAISGGLAALAGCCFASQLLAAQGSLGSTTTLDSVTAAVLGGASLLGGIGSAPGAVLGVLIIGVIQDGLTLMHVQSFWAQLISGVVLIAAVAFAGLRAKRR